MSDDDNGTNPQKAADQTTARPASNLDPIAGIADKVNRAEQFVALSAISQQSVENRREYEFKASFAVWGGIATATAFVLIQDVQLNLATLTVISLALIGGTWAWLFKWQPLVHAAHQEDKDWKHYYSEIAECLLGSHTSEQSDDKGWPLRPDHKDWKRRSSSKDSANEAYKQKWQTPFMLISLAVVAGSVLLLWASWLFRHESVATEQGPDVQVIENAPFGTVNSTNIGSVDTAED